MYPYIYIYIEREREIDTREPSSASRGEPRILATLYKVNENKVNKNKVNKNNMNKHNINKHKINKHKVNTNPAHHVDVVLPGEEGLVTLCICLYTYVCICPPGKRAALHYCLFVCFCFGARLACNLSGKRASLSRLPYLTPL